MTTHAVLISTAKRTDSKGRVAGIGRWFAEYDGAVIGEFANPEADSAKYLLDKGLAEPSDTITTYRGDMRAMIGNVGALAGWQPVSEQQAAFALAGAERLRQMHAAA